MGNVEGEIALDCLLLVLLLAVLQLQEEEKDG